VDDRLADGGEVLVTPAKPWQPVKGFAQAYHNWKQPKPHPLTGDLLAPSERITWFVMNVYRRWSVFFLLQILTIVWWTHPHLFPGDLAGWNYLWSDLAVVVEMMVGIAFMNQSMRDAKVMRKSLADLQTEGDLIRDIHAALHPDGDGHVVIRRIPGDGEVLELKVDNGKSDDGS
jgi:hypothetical protein